jgi:serine/threonine protein kinase
MVVIKTLDSGFFGTTYLCKKGTKLYVKKIQKIINSDKDSFIWKEISLFKYINKLSSADRKFYMRLYSYNIIKDCKHKQKLPFKPEGKLLERVEALDKSKLGIEYNVTYLKGPTLAKFNISKLSRKAILSFCLQIYKMIITLHKGGYYHNDTHPANIIVTKTTDKYFTLYGNRISYYGYQLVLIDYGEVTSKKFIYNADEKEGLSLMFDHEKIYLRKQLYDSITNFVNPMIRLIEEHKRHNIKLPFDKKSFTFAKTLTRIIKHKEFVEAMILKYSKLTPNGIKIFKEVIADGVVGEDYRKFLGGNIIQVDFWDFTRRLIDEFWILYPRLYQKYAGWCSTGKFALGYKDFEQLMSVNSSNAIFNKLMHMYSSHS